MYRAHGSRPIFVQTNRHSFDDVININLDKASFLELRATQTGERACTLRALETIGQLEAGPVHAGFIVISRITFATKEYSWCVCFWCMRTLGAGGGSSPVLPRSCTV